MLIFLIVCPLVFLAGFVDAIAGGGGLISLPAYLIAGLPVQNAIATNKLSSCMGTTIAFSYYLKKGFMSLPICAPAVLLALTGSTLGSNLTLHLSDQILKLAMLVILPLTGVYVLRCQSLEHPSEEAYPLKKTILYACLFAFVIGLYDGFYGPGTGTFLMLLLTGVAHMSLNQAAGTTKAINLSTNVAALAVFLINGKALLPLGIVAGLCNMLGNYFGSRCFVQKSSSFIRPLILVVLVLAMGKIITEYLGIF